MIYVLYSKDKDIETSETSETITIHELMYTTRIELYGFHKMSSVNFLNSNSFNGLQIHNYRNTWILGRPH